MFRDDEPRDNSSWPLTGRAMDHIEEHLEPFKEVVGYVKKYDKRAERLS